MPVGALAFAGILLFMPDTARRIRRFDFFGFALLSLAVGSLQFMLDRGADRDWFNSWEILIETGLAVAATWAFVVHTMTAREPFLHRGLFTDRNFSAALVFIFVIGVVLLATVALLPPMLTNIYGYPVIIVGLVLAPRGVGTMASMLVVGRLVRKVDSRLLVLFGLGLTAYSLWGMSFWSPEMDWWPVVTNGVIQGFGLGFVFVPLSTVAFQTLDPRMRTEAASLFNLVRNLGSSIGISIMAALLTRNLAINHASLVTHITPFNGALLGAGINPSTFDTSAGQQTAAMVDGMVTQQAAMIAYLNDFKLMFWITLAAVPLLLILRNRPVPATASAGAMAPQPAMAD